MTSGQRHFGGSVRAIPDYWTADLVAENLIAAIGMLRQMPDRGPRLGGGNGWPETLREYEDLVIQLGAGETFKERNRSRQILTADQVSRVNEVITWQARYLADYPGPARVLKLWLLSRTTRATFRALLRRAQIPPATAYRARDRAITLITRGLTRDEVAVFGLGRLR